MKLSEQKLLALKAIVAKFGQNAKVSNKELLAFGKTLESLGFVKADYNWLFNPKFRVGRGVYQLPLNGETKNVSEIPIVAPEQTQPQMINTVSFQKFDPNVISEFGHSTIPERDKHYVPFGDFKDVEQIIKSRIFFPVFIAGMSGNGKTFMVEQACARARRAMVRVQMARETDEDDLIGGFRLINGETKFMKGPVLSAMENGDILLIDEADRADPGKVMCLQGILEGKPYYVKKTGEIIRPVSGFNIIVTANTKGKGSEDGRYVAAGVLDDAWLERFPITIEQDYPSIKIESRILESYMKDNREITEQDRKFLSNLIVWADIIRKTFNEGALDEIISTRRLVHIVQTYIMFDQKRMRAIELCINRFDAETRNAFLELYSKVDAEVGAPQTPSESAQGEAEPPSPF